jgi:hypothetical protein
MITQLDALPESRLTPTPKGIMVEFAGRSSYYIISNKAGDGFPEQDEPCTLYYMDYKGAPVYKLLASDKWEARRMIDLLVKYDIEPIDTGGGCHALGFADYTNHTWYFLLTSLLSPSLPNMAEPTTLYYYDNEDNCITGIDGLPAERALHHIADFIELLDGRLG